MRGWRRRRRTGRRWTTSSGTAWQGDCSYSNCSSSRSSSSNNTSSRYRGRKRRSQSSHPTLAPLARKEAPLRLTLTQVLVAVWILLHVAQRNYLSTFNQMIVAAGIPCLQQFHALNVLTSTLNLVLGTARIPCLRQFTLLNGDLPRATRHRRRSRSFLFGQEARQGPTLQCRPGARRRSGRREPSTRRRRGRRPRARRRRRRLLPLTGPPVLPAARTGGSLCAEIVGKPTNK